MVKKLPAPKRWRRISWRSPETGATAIDIDDEGKAFISAPNQEALDCVMNYLNSMLEMPEVGKIYQATVVKIMNFGAFCEFMPGK